MKAIRWRRWPAWGERRRPKSNPHSRRHRLRWCRPGPSPVRDSARLARLSEGRPSRQRALGLRRRGGHVARAPGGAIERAWLRARTLSLRALPEGRAGRRVPGATARGGHRALAAPPGVSPALPPPLITTRRLGLFLCAWRFGRSL